MEPAGAGVDEQLPPRAGRLGRVIGRRVRLAAILVFLLVFLAGLEMRYSTVAVLLPLLLERPPLPPRPPALSPPSPPRGLGSPSHYTFSALSVLPDFVDVAVTQAGLLPKIKAFPLSQRRERENIRHALWDLREPIFKLALWLDDIHWQQKSTPSVESNNSRQALMALHKACSVIDRELGSANEIEGRWGAAHSSWPLENARQEHRPHFEAYAWAFQPDEDDLGQYDDMELVGDANRHEAANLNRSAAIFLSNLSSKHLPQLLEFRSWCSKTLVFRDELARVKAETDKLAEGIERVSRTDWIEAAKSGLEEYGILSAPCPNLFRRTLLWVQRREWDYPCPRTADFDAQGQSHADRFASEGRSWVNDYALFYRLWTSPDNYYHPTGMWNCVLANHRTVQEKVVPLVRKAQAEITDALTLFDTAVRGAGEKLQTQMSELLAGRGWEVVEQAEIGMTHDHHWVEVSRAKPGSLTNIRNVTLWRRMILPLDLRALERLEWGEGQIERLRS